MPKRSQQGFTLIELLVVIAIIGILAAMVITNLRTARQKARDASAITSMSSARAEAENFYDVNGLTYGLSGGTGSTICDASVPFRLLLDAAEDANGGTAECQAEDQTYTAYIDLFSVDNTIFCIDGTGFAGRIEGTGTSTLEPATPGESCR